MTILKKISKKGKALLDKRKKVDKKWDNAFEKMKTEKPISLETREEINFCVYNLNLIDYEIIQHDPNIFRILNEPLKQ